MKTIQAQFEYLKSQPSDITIWKKTDYFGYDVSSTGDVYSLKSGKILKKQTDRQGYSVLNIRVNGKIISIKLHRLVAHTFIVNIEDKPCVNHINGNKSDNRVENLERVTYKENENHSWKTLGKKPTWYGKTGIHHPISKQIGQYDLNGKLLKVRNGSGDIQRSLGINYKYISDYCLGKIKSKNFIWKYL